MTHIPYLFNQSTEQMRRIGARGGRTHARNWRARQVAALAGPRELPTPDTHRRRPPSKPWRSWMRNLPGCEAPRIPSDTRGPHG